MTNPRDDNRTLRRIYASLADAAYDEEEHNRRWAARAHRQVVEAHRQPPGTLLDVGCATGIFVGVAVESGWEATGLEASEWAVEKARQRYPQGRFVRALLDEAEFGPGEFDVVTLWDVLEHVASPVAALRRVQAWTKPGGYVFLSLPNFESLSARLMGRHWVLLLREHLWYFSPRTIEALLGRAGLVLVETRPKSVRFSVANVLGRLGQYGGVTGKLARRLSGAQGLRRWSVQFGIGEMDVVARRCDDENRRGS